MKKVISETEAVAKITGMRPRNGSADEPIVEYFAERIAEGYVLDISAFVQVIMHLSSDSKHAPVYHAYAAEHFGSDDELWSQIAHMARHGSDLRRVAKDKNLRKTVREIRSGSVLYGKSIAQKIDPGNAMLNAPMSRRLKALVKRLEKASVANRKAARSRHSTKLCSGLKGSVCSV